MMLEIDIRSSDLFAAGAPERTDAEVEEEQEQSGGDEKLPMIGAVKCAGAHAVQTLAEDEDEEQEEEAHDFEEHDAPDALKGAEEASKAAGEAAGGAGGGWADGAGRGARG